MTEKRIRVDRAACHAALDKWLDEVERDAPGVRDSTGWSVIKLSAVHDSWIGEKDRLAYGSVRVETRAYSDLEYIGGDQ